MIRRAGQPRPIQQGDDWQIPPSFHLMEHGSKLNAANARHIFVHQYQFGVKTAEGGGKPGRVRHLFRLHTGLSQSPPDLAGCILVVVHHQHSVGTVIDNRHRLPQRLRQVWQLKRGSEEMRASGTNRRQADFQVIPLRHHDDGGRRRLVLQRREHFIGREKVRRKGVPVKKVSRRLLPLALCSHLVGG